MADTFIGINKGLQLTTVTDGSSTTSKAVELRIADTVTKKADIIQAIRHIEAYVIQKNNLPFD